MMDAPFRLPAASWDVRMIGVRKILATTRLLRTPRLVIHRAVTLFDYYWSQVEPDLSKREASVCAMTCLVLVNLTETKKKDFFEECEDEIIKFERRILVHCPMITKTIPEWIWELYGGKEIVVETITPEMETILRRADATLKTDVMYTFSAKQIAIAVAGGGVGDDFHSQDEYDLCVKSIS
jgi:hypothetical protein